MNRPSMIWICFGGLFFAAGCDLGTYSSRYAERLPQLQQRARLAAHLHSTYVPLVGTNVEIRLPVRFDGETRRIEGAGLGELSESALPLQFSFPLSFVFERYVEGADGEQLPIYLYFATVPVSEMDAAALEDSISASVASKIPDPPRWADVSVATLDGKEVPYRALRISAAQPFQVRETSGRGVSRSLEGQWTFHVRTVGDRHVVLSYRYPSQMADTLGFPEGLEASLGTFRTR